MQREELRSFLHLVWACCCTSSLQDFQCGSGYHREETEIDWEEPPLTTGYHQRICDNHTRGDISSQRVAESTMWTGLAQGPNPVLGEDKTLSTFTDCSLPSNWCDATTGNILDTVLIIMKRKEKPTGRWHARNTHLRKRVVYLVEYLNVWFR